MDLSLISDVPNEEVTWGIWIAMYIFFTGMSAGSFVLSSLGNVFGIEKYKPLSKLGAIIATLLLAMAPLFLIIDLEQPLRAYTTLLRPHPSSAMSWGVFLLTLYPINCVLYSWFLWRADIIRMVERASNSRLFMLFHKGLEIMRQTDLSAKSLARDARRAKIIGTVGVPLAIAVHGYTGFLLSTVAAKDLWHTSLMPVLFLVSAIVSGIALFIIVFVVKDRFFTHRKEINRELVFDLGRLMGGMIVVDLALLVTELITLGNSGSEGREVLTLLLEGPYRTTFLGVELLLGALVPLVIIFNPRTGRTIAGQIIASILVLIGIAAMRYNVIIGGQAIPMGRGEIVEYTMSFVELAGVVIIISMLALLIILALKVLPFDLDTEHIPGIASEEGLEDAKNGGGSTEINTTTSEKAETLSTNVRSESVSASSYSMAAPDDLEMTRREFIKTSTSALALFALGAWGPRNIFSLFQYLEENPSQNGARRYAMVIDLQKCIGCNSCTQACKEEFDVPAGVWRAWVKKLRKTIGSHSRDYFLPRLCNHCDNPPCVRVCPVKATYQDADGFVLQRYDKCIGCKYCIVACPYSARFIHPEMKVADKCTFCDHRVRKGLEPACVTACPVNARIFGDLNDPESEVAKLVATLPMHTLKPELGTEPMVFYHEADGEIMKGGLI